MLVKGVFRCWCRQAISKRDVYVDLWLWYDNGLMKSYVFMDYVLNKLAQIYCVRHTFDVYSIKLITMR